jgi:hypothetical protein
VNLRGPSYIIGGVSERHQSHHVSLSGSQLSFTQHQALEGSSCKNRLKNT